MIHFLQSESDSISFSYVADMLREELAQHSWHKVLLIPPDITRSHSGAGAITDFLYRELTADNCEVRVLPALGTHTPMTEDELHEMFGTNIPMDAYLVHEFRKTITEVGVVPGAFLNEISEGLFTEDVHVSINPELLDKSYDAVLSIGQVVPHEIAGMANYTKNIVVGCGGGELINVSHFLGVFWELDRILGRDINPVRKLFDYIQDNLLCEISFTFIQTVMTQIDGVDCYKGVYIGQGREPYNMAVKLSKKVNFNLVDRPIDKCVVWMDPHSYHSTWVTNKAIYRTQLAVKPGGEIIIIAPGVHTFGENDLADGIIRKYGYTPRDKMLELRKTEPTLRDNLSLAGHLIHGCPEGIHVTYCTDKLSREEMEKANFGYMSVEEALAKYPCQNWKTGWQKAADGSEVYFVANAALGLWCCEEIKE